jgi:FHA domain-containing protein
MRRGEMGLGGKRALFTVGGPVGAGRLSTWTRGEPMNLLLQRPEETFRYVRTLFERLRGANVLAVQWPRAVESTEGRAFDVLLFGLTPAAAVAARALRLAHLPFRVGRLPVAGEAQPIEGNDLQLSDTKPFNVSRNHFAIERGPDGVQVRDCGSYVGTIVNGVQIGGHRHIATGRLAVGENEVVAGGPRSPFRFRVVVTLGQLSST